MPSQQLINIIIKATDEASAAANKVDENLKRIGESSSRLSKIPGFDTLKNKISSVGESIDNRFGGALTRARERVSGFTGRISNATSTIRDKFGGALSNVKNKIDNFNNSAKQTSSAFGLLKSAGSMAIGMIGYDLVNSLVETTRASLNARSSIQAFASRLNMSGTEVTAFQQSLDELQNTYKKIDMDVVGAQATDLAYRLGLPKTSLSELTETTAIFMDAMQRNGRSAEDSMLAMSDAMDGQFTRLKELGISQEDLMNNGWSGDLEDKEGLLKAINKALKDQNYDELAKSVDNLDDAWQVLSITLSNLLESIILPLTPAIVAIITGFTSAIEMIKSAWNGLPDWGKIAIGVGALAVALGILIPALMATEAASLPLVPTLYAIAGAVMGISWPIVAVVAAIGLLVVAIYEIGKAFGWWSDVNSMLAAIGAGIQRLWSAFINHPDVQAAISMISNALSTLWSWIVQAGQAVLEFFGISSEGNFDVVRAIIDGIGAAWEAVTYPIRVVIGLIEWLIAGFTSVQETVTGVWDAIMAVIGPYVSQIVGFIMSLIGVFDQFKAGQMNLPQFIITILSMLWSAYLNVTTQIAQLILRFGGQVLTYAVNAGRNFLNGVMNQVKQTPGRVLSALLQVISSIVSAGQQWISNAVSQARGVVDGAAGALAALPGRISSALGGVVDAIVAPFRSAYDSVCGVVDQIKGKVEEGMQYLGSLVSFGGDTAFGGDVAISNDTARVVHSSEPLEVNENINLTLDLRDVPSGMDEDRLLDALNSREFIQAFVSNPVFQEADARVKRSISLKANRHMGV